MAVLNFIDWIYRGFVFLLTGWSIGHFIAFITLFPVIVLALQCVFYGRSRRYAFAYGRLKRFLKKHSYVTSRNIWVFNKKVARVFPKYIYKQAKHIAQKGLPLSEIAEIFKGECSVRSKNVVASGYVIHILSLGIVMYMNGYGIEVIAFAAIALSLVWIAVATADKLLSLLFAYVDGKSRKKFVFALERNVALDCDEIDLTVPTESYEIRDSVNDLAKSVEEFLASRPDKGIAQVVLKSLYSSSFSGAMKVESARRLKNVMQQLKNYVG